MTTKEKMKELVTFKCYDWQKAKYVAERQEESLKYDQVEIIEEHDSLNHCDVYIVACEPMKV